METTPNVTNPKLFTVDYQVLGTRDGAVHKAGTITLAAGAFWDIGPILDACLGVKQHNQVLRLTRIEKVC